MWGRARVVENDPALVEKLFDKGYKARPERAILFTIEAWDVNCSAHIVTRFTEAEIGEALATVQAKIAELEAENARLRALVAGHAADGPPSGPWTGLPAAGLGARPPVRWRPAAGRPAAARVALPPRASALRRRRTRGRPSAAPRPTRVVPPSGRRRAAPAAPCPGEPLPPRAPSLTDDAYPDSYIRGILNTVKTIAMVGISPKDNRPSYFAFKYLQERGYRMIPVNPGQAGQKILGQKVYATLSEIPEPVDMVDIFRSPEHVLPIVQEALTLNPKPQVIWMQLTVRNEEAARLAEQAGLKVVMNRCPKIEYGRLSSEISWIGVNSRVLTSKRARGLGKGVQRMGLGHGTLQGGTTDAADRVQKNEENSG